MKTVYLLFILYIVSGIHTGIMAQQATIRKKSAQMNRVNKTSRKKESAAEKETHPWMRIIYREIDLRKEQNIPLYQHLPALLFRELEAGRLEAYEYLDGKELFEDRYKRTMDQLTEHFHLQENSVERIQSFYLKECWYFNQHTSAVEVKPVALCPVLYSYSANGTEFRMPLCWIPYEAAQSCLSETYLKISGKNNALQLTFSHYFTLRLFRGDIIKTENMQNRTLIQYCLTPDSLRKERERIENELSGFVTRLSTP